MQGRFYRIAFQNDLPTVLLGARSEHGRYHYQSRTAIYMSPTVDWAWTALDVYVRPDDPPRTAIALDVSPARVLDLRDSAACSAAGIEVDDALSPWRDAIASGRKPTSWAVAERVRELGFDGLVDVSRRIPDGWHLVLFHWNAPGRPTVTIAEDGQGSS